MATKAASKPSRSHVRTYMFRGKRYSARKATKAEIKRAGLREACICGRTKCVFDHQQGVSYVWKCTGTSSERCVWEVTTQRCSGKVSKRKKQAAPKRARR